MYNNKVLKVFHPALPNNDNYTLWCKYFSGSTGLFSFILKEQSKNVIYKMIDKLKLFKLGFSWGGYESLILPVFPKNERKIIGLLPYLSPIIGAAKRDKILAIAIMLSTPEAVTKLIPWLTAIGIAATKITE